MQHEMLHDHVKLASARAEIIRPRRLPHETPDASVQSMATT
jgi:hypothetical protein